MAAAGVKRRLPDDLSTVEFETSEDLEVVPTFDKFRLKEDLIRGIYAYGTFIIFSGFNQLACNGLF